MYWVGLGMKSGEMSIRKSREELLSRIAKRVKNGERYALKPFEIPMLLEWIIESADEQERDELLKLLKRLRGLDMVRAALSDYT